MRAASGVRASVFAFDAKGRLTSEQRPGQSAPTTWSYQHTGRLSKVVSPNGTLTSYGYRADGLLETQTRLATAGSTQPDAVRAYAYTLKRLSQVTESETAPASALLSSVRKEGYDRDGDGFFESWRFPVAGAPARAGYDEDEDYDIDRWDAPGAPEGWCAERCRVGGAPLPAPSVR